MNPAATYAVFSIPVFLRKHSLTHHVLIQLCAPLCELNVPTYTIKLWICVEYYLESSGTQVTTMNTYKYFYYCC